MDPADKESIRCNLVELERQTDLSSLLSKLLQKGVFSDKMMEKYQSSAAHVHVRKRELYMDIQTRGPLAFQKLLEALIETGHFDLARLLKPNIDIENYIASQSTPPNRPDQQQPEQHRTTMFTLPAYIASEQLDVQQRLRTLANEYPGTVFSMSTEPLVINVKQATYRCDEVFSHIPTYSMGSRPKGYFLMINNIEFINNVQKLRNGADIDERNLKTLFEGLGYVVIHERNQGLADMRRKIDEFSKMTEHSRVDSCVVAVMSHGESNDSDGTRIAGSDGKFLPVTEILDYFDHRNSPLLRGKPKIFIFPTCRGFLVDHGIKQSSEGRTEADSVPDNIVLRTKADMLIAWSTIYGSPSYRDKFFGSWFVNYICKIFMDHAHDTDICDMLVMVDQHLSRLISEDNALQTSCFENRAFKKFYFNPGLYDDNDCDLGTREHEQAASNE